jgi:aspartate racemase
MATIGHVTEDQRQVFFEAGRALCARGAEAIMLGGTDLFLAFAGHDPGFSVIDCADIHVDAIYATSAA